MKFTDKYIQSLKPREKEYCIRESHGFTIRILPSGSKTFQYIYTIQGKRRRLNLGSYPATTLSEAREKFHEVANLVSKGVDPQTPPPEVVEPAHYTVARLIEEYLTHLEKSAARNYVKTASLTLKNDVLKNWGERKIESIRRRDAISLVENVATRAKAQALGVLKHTRAMFSYALHRELVDFNPFAGVSAAIPDVAPTSRERVLSDSEIKFVWNTLSEKESVGSQIARASLLLILVTAQRPGEVAGMSKAEVDGEWWTIPKDRAKNKEEHRVYLSHLARKLLPELICPWYFPSPGLDAPVSRAALSHVLSKNPKDKEGNATRLQYLGLPRWTPHDLRRTAATKLSELGCPDEVIDAILNHVKKGVIGVYNRNKYEKEKKNWLNRWAMYLEELVEK